MGLPRRLLVLCVKQAATTLGEAIGETVGTHASAWLHERLGGKIEIVDDPEIAKEIAARQRARRKKRDG